MTNRPCKPLWIGWALGALAGLLVAVCVTMLPGQAWATHVCTQAGGPSTTLDSDGDGFTDAQECAGITTIGSGTAPDRKTFPVCTPTMSRVDCVDPDSKDVFVIYRPAATGSLLTGLSNPFGNNTFYGVVFTGLTALGVTAHQLTPAQAATDRAIISVPAGQFVPRAVRVSESLTDGALTDALGYCQFGTPQGLDGCAVYTKRTKAFIDSKCNGAGDMMTDRNQVFLSYATYIMLHETGHTLGGLAARYDAALGGYHYSPTANLVMSQAAQYSTQGGRCTFYIPSLWNPVLDPPAVILK